MSIHTGARPEGVTREYEGRRWELVEELPLGGIRYWDKRQLKSGCGKKVIDKGGELVYCPHCDGWFAIREFTCE